jgi:DNA transposition AAA+ family ATPase
MSSEQHQIKLSTPGDGTQAHLSPQRQDALGELMASARRQRVARILPDGTLSWQHIQQVQKDFQEFRERHNLSLLTVAGMMGRGFSQATVSQFLATESLDEYVGDIERVARGLNQFMETYLQSQEVARPSGFVETEVAKRMMAVIRNAIEMRSIGLIYSDAGRGKTMTLQAAAKVYVQAILVRVLRSTRTPTGLARQLCGHLRLKGGSLYEMQTRLIDHLTGSARPLMIDEAHQLTSEALEFVRDLHDACDIPVILAGTRRIVEATSDDHEFFGQLSSRIALRYDVLDGHADIGGSGGGGSGGRKRGKLLHSVDEIRRVFESDKVRLTDDAAELLARVANVLGFGGLRTVSRLIFVAARICKGAIDAALVTKVLRQCAGSEWNDQIDRRLADQVVKAMTA